MTLWLVLAAMTAATLFAVLAPLLRRADPQPARAEHDMEVYRDQLAEIDRDLERGFIGADESEAAKAEIGRRMFAAADEKGQIARPAAANARSLVVAGVAAGIPILGLMLYQGVGSPNLPGRPLTERPPMAAGAGPEQSHDLDSMVARLAERMRQTPDDPQGWMRLGRSYSIVGRFDAAIEAYRRALLLGVDDPALDGNYGLALVMQAQGLVTPEALAAFESVLEVEPGDARARFYVGMSKFQGGDARAALVDWIELEKGSPAGASWLPALREQIAELAGKAGIDAAAMAQTVKPRIAAGAPAAIAMNPPGSAPPLAAPAAPTPAAPRGPTPEQMAAAAQMPAQDRMAMVRGMVDGLAARLETEPNDVEGWLRLGRSYKVLDEPQKSADALARAAKLSPNRVDVLTDYAGALLAASAGRPPPAYIETMRRLLTLDSTNAELMYRVGIAEAEAGNRERAAQLFSQLLARMPPAAPLRPDLQRRLDQLKVAN